MLLVDLGRGPSLANSKQILSHCLRRQYRTTSAQCRNYTPRRSVVGVGCLEQNLSQEHIPCIWEFSHCRGWWEALSEFLILEIYKCVREWLHTSRKAGSYCVFFVCWATVYISWCLGENKWINKSLLVPFGKREIWSPSNLRLVGLRRCQNLLDKVSLWPIVNRRAIANWARKVEESKAIVMFYRR